MNYFLFEADDHDLDLVFSEEELEVFRNQWKQNVSVTEIAETTKRKISEVALLVFDHAERGLIKQRDRSLHRL